MLPSSSVSSLRYASQQPPFSYSTQSLLAIIQSSHQRSAFSNTASRCARRHPAYKKRRDGNSDRGVSALRRTGLKFPVAMSRQPLPRPVLDPERRTKVEGNPDHGLWGFFNSRREALTKPEDEEKHGIL